MLAMLNAPLLAYLGFAALVVLIVLAAMVMSRRYSLAIRWFGFNLLLSPGSMRHPPDSGAPGRK